MFQLDAPDLINLLKFYKRAPAKFKRAQINVINDFAFGTRRQAIDVIKNNMTVRNERFVSGSMRVNKANLGRMYSEVGSIERPRFSGWVEQQKGKKRATDRVATKAGRSGNYNRRIPPKSKLRGIKRIRGGKAVSKTFRMRPKNAFILDRSSGNFTPGVYRFMRKRLTMVQRFKGRNPQPKRFDWIGKAEDQYITPGLVRKSWKNAIDRVL